MATTIMVGIMGTMACIGRTHPSIITKPPTQTLGTIGPTQDSTITPATISLGGPLPAATLGTMQPAGNLRSK
jgi:hypothetical protein